MIIIINIIITIIMLIVIINRTNPRYLLPKDKLFVYFKSPEDVQLQFFSDFFLYFPM